MKLLGKLLWLSFETVVILEESMRQSGTENAEFIGVLQRSRDGICNDDNFAL